MPTTALFDLAVRSVGFDRDGALSLLANTRPPPRIDGLSIGVALMERPAPHCIVPRGLWHRVIPRGEVRLLYATPGPNTERRSLTT